MLINPPFRFIQNLSSPLFDVWVEKNWKGIEFERYADDIICHCVSEREASELLSVLNNRFNECGLQLHPTKTKISYCKGGRNKGDYENVSFDFLGYTFRPRWIKTRRGHQGLYFHVHVILQEMTLHVQLDVFLDNKDNKNEEIIDWQKNGDSLLYKSYKNQTKPT